MIADRSRAAVTSTYRGEPRGRSGSAASEGSARRFYDPSLDISFVRSGAPRRIALPQIGGHVTTTVGLRLINLRIHHRTIYRFRALVRFGPHRLLLRPRESRDLRLILSNVTVTPAAVGT